MTASPVTFRPATAADADAVSALLDELGYPTSPAAIPSRLAALHSENGTVLLAVDISKSPLGMICLARHAVLHDSGPVAYITALVVATQARRRGVGRQMVQAAIKWAAAHGCVRLSVTSAERRTDAHVFYPACGLRYTGRRFSTAV
ncbi:MAG: GNAT family N-acetyltransferase [Gemmatimonadaceae bacterium]